MRRLSCRGRWCQRGGILCWCADRHRNNSGINSSLRMTSESKRDGGRQDQHVFVHAPLLLETISLHRPHYWSVKKWNVQCHWGLCFHQLKTHPFWSLSNLLPTGMSSQHTSHIQLWTLFQDDTKDGNSVWGNRWQAAWWCRSLWPWTWQAGW